MKKTLILTLIGLPAIAVSTLQAQLTVIDWQGDYVTANQTLGAASVVTGEFGDPLIGGNPVPGNDVRRAIDFSTTTPLFGTSLDYTGPNIFGGAEWITYSLADADVNTEILSRVREIGTDDILQDYVQSNNGGTKLSSVAYIRMFAAGGTTLDSTTVWRLNLVSAFNTQDDNPLNLPGTDGTGTRGHWLVEDAGQFYISEVALAHNDFDGDPNNVHVLNGVGSTNWAPVDFTGSIINQDTGSLTYSSVASFGDVDWVGFYSENDLFSPSGSGSRYSEFSVVNVPEPGTYVLVFGVMGLALVLWRRRAKA